MLPSVTDLLVRFDQDDLDAAGAADLGRALFDALFSATARDLLQRGLSYAEQRGQRPRLLLSLPREAHAAAALPWELLHDAGGTPLLCRELAIVRRIPLDTTTSPPLEAPMLRVLLAAAPTDPPAPVARELAEIRDALATVAGRVAVDVEETITPAILQRRLREEFHVWHHVGHGRPDGSLALLDEVGDPLPVNPAQLGAFGSVAFLHNGASVVTVGADGAIRCWHIDHRAAMEALRSRLLRELTAEERTQYGLGGG